MKLLLKIFHVSIQSATSSFKTDVHYTWVYLLPEYCWVEAAVWLLCWVPIKNIVNSPFSRWSWQIFQNPIKISFRLDLGQNVVLTSLFSCCNTMAEKVSECLISVEHLNVLGINASLTKLEGPSILHQQRTGWVGLSKVIIEKSRGEGSLIEQDTKCVVA